MGRVLPLLALLGLVAGAAGCSSTECTLIGCSDQARVVLLGLGDRLATRLPVTVTACVGGACNTFRIEAGDAGLVCGWQAPTINASCTARSGGDVVLVISLPATTGATISVHATASDPSGNVFFDGTGSAAVADQEINGPGCGICRTADVTVAG
jgi:hypothetical protein